MAWNELFVGAHPILPFHLGSVRSSNEVGSSAESMVAECTSVRALPDIPTHVRSAGFAHLATGSVISLESWLNLPAAERKPSPPGSWAKNISAGLLSPSSKVMAARGKVLSYLTLTSMPVASSNCSTIAPTKLSFLPEYKTSSPGSFSTSTLTSLTSSLTTSFSTISVEHDEARKVTSNAAMNMIDMTISIRGLKICNSLFNLLNPFAGY